MLDYENNYSHDTDGTGNNDDYSEFDEVSDADDENTDSLDPEYRQKLDEMNRLLDNMDVSKASVFKRLIKAFEIVYAMPKSIAGRSFIGCHCTGAEPSYLSFVAGTINKSERTVMGAKSRVKREFGLAYDHATSYFDDDGDYSLIEKAEKNISDQLELKEHELMHELTLINKQRDISDEISRIKALMTSTRLMDEVRDTFQNYVSTRILNRFSSFSELLDMAEYEKLSDGGLFGEVNIDAADAWNKLNDELFNGVEKFISRSFEVEHLFDKKCSYPISLILEEIKETLIEAIAA